MSRLEFDISFLSHTATPKPQYIQTTRTNPKYIEIQHTFAACIALTLLGCDICFFFFWQSEWGRTRRNVKKQYREKWRGKIWYRPTYLTSQPDSCILRTTTNTHAQIANGTVKIGEHFIAYYPPARSVVLYMCMCVCRILLDKHADNGIVHHGKSFACTVAAFS